MEVVRNYFYILEYLWLVFIFFSFFIRIEFFVKIYRVRVFLRIVIKYRFCFNLLFRIVVFCFFYFRSFYIGISGFRFVYVFCFLEIFVLY